MKQNKNKIIDSRIIITGNIGRYKRFEKVENYLEGRDAKDIDLDKIRSMIDVQFAGKNIDDPKYTSHLAAVEISRGIDQLRGEK